jgi:amino acid adenylation domain-containing protein
VNVLEGIIAQSIAHPDRTAIKDQDLIFTYKRLSDEAALVANGFSQHGVKEGDRVALLLDNSTDFVVSALASMWVGAIYVPMAVSDPQMRLAKMFADSAPALVVVADQSDRSRQPPPVSGVEYTRFSSLRSDSSPSVSPVADCPRPTYSMYTSGTTGTPKGVLVGSRAFLAAVESTALALDLGENTRTLCVSPFYFDGSFATLFPTLYCGGLVVLRPFSLLFSRTFFDTVINEQITYTGFSPSFLRLLLASSQMPKLARSHLDVIALGGEASTPSDLNQFQSYAPNIRIFNRYGPTETTIVVTHQHVTPEIVSTGVVPLGRPHAGVTFHLIDGEGNFITEAGRIGELYIGGVQLMDGYWGAPALTDEVVRDDVITGEKVYKTGDLVFRTEDGNYVYVDRADRVINRHGLRISLIEVAEALRSVPHVVAAACVTYDDHGDLGVASFVVTDAPMSSVALREAALEQLPEAMLPNRFEFVKELPLNKSNKLDEKRLLLDFGLTPLRTITPS